MLTASCFKSISVKNFYPPPEHLWVLSMPGKYPAAGWLQTTWQKKLRFSSRETLNAVFRNSVNLRLIPKGVDIIRHPLGIDGRNPGFPGFFPPSLVYKPVDTGDNFKLSTRRNLLFCKIMSTIFPPHSRERICRKAKRLSGKNITLLERWSEAARHGSRPPQWRWRKPGSAWRSFADPEC